MMYILNTRELFPVKNLAGRVNIDFYILKM